MVHDVDRGRGNIDHIATGPPGIFLGDSKDLHGAVSVARGRLSVRWREAPDDGYENRSLAPRIHAAAVELERGLHRHGCASARIQPLAALWARFEQRSIMSGGVAWVRGNDLADVLQRRPVTLTQSEVDRAAAALRLAMRKGPLA